MTDLTLRVKTLITDRLNLRISPEQIQNDTPIFDSQDGGLGLDSIDALDLAVGLFEEFQIEVGQNDMYIFASVNTITAFIQEKLEVRSEPLLSASHANSAALHAAGD